MFCLVSFQPSESFSAVWIIPTAIAPQLTETISQIDEVFYQEEHILAVAIQLYESGKHVTSSSIVRKRFNFDKSRPSLQLYKDQVLGIGSYGTVCRAKYNGFICAAKFLHPIFKINVGFDIFSERFQQECSLLSALRHPNIVQYFGVGQDPESGDPVLFMELIEGKDLTQFLKASLTTLPFHVEVNICHDVAQALAYLHSNKVIHSNLSSCNVLLMGSALKAKVCDFGSATVLNHHPTYHQSLTVCPGTPVYMPPEAFGNNPKYNVKLDSFSFGVLTVEVLTRLFPEPESQDRQKHISRIDPQHPLLEIALDCLKDNDGLRPSAGELCERIESLKVSQAYRDSEAQVTVTIPERLALTNEILSLESGAPAQGELLQITEHRALVQVKKKTQTSRKELEQNPARNNEECEHPRRLQGQSSCVCM